MKEGKVGWFDLQQWDEWEQHQWCEAPRHRVNPAVELGTPAVYVMIIHFPPDFDYEFQAMCPECMDMIAKDYYNTTAEKGKLVKE
jgi:hypothetical protein